MNSMTPGARSIIHPGIAVVCCSRACGVPDFVVMCGPLAVFVFYGILFLLILPEIRQISSFYFYLVEKIQKKAFLIERNG